MDENKVEKVESVVEKWRRRELEILYSDAGCDELDDACIALCNTRASVRQLMRYFIKKSSKTSEELAENSDISDILMCAANDLSELHLILRRISERIKVKITEAYGDRNGEKKDD